MQQSSFRNQATTASKLSMKCGPGTAVLGGQILGRGLGSARWEQLHLRSVRWPLSRRAAAGASESLATGRRLLSIGTGFQSRGAGRTAAQASRRHVGAIAAPEDCVYVKEHPLGTHNRARVEVSVAADGSQIIVITTDFPGNRLVLHWGVEGGQGYQGGWRLPGASARPEGTIQYKNRALQTPFHSATGDDGKPMQRVQVVLPTEEASDAINFVFKDEATGSWYDLYDSNYSAPLNPMLMSTVAATVASMDSMDAIDFEASMDFITDIPEIPQELAGIWAYIKWELAGCPNRSQEAADLEYQEGIVELQRLLATGTALDELWRVARGELQYRDFMTRQQLPGGKRGAAPARPSAPPAVAVPEDLVGIQAYIMWEQAGKPDGADFSSAAREELQRKLEAGMTTDDIRQLLQGPPQPKASGAVQQAPPAPKAPPPPAEPQVGQGLGVSWQDPLTMIKKMEAPKLSAERKVREVKPLDYLVQSAAVDDSVVWRRLFPLGSKAELLVCVRREEGPNGRVVLQFTTDLPSELVLHWGVTLPKQGHSWAAPPAALLPPRAERMEGGLAAELAFTDCKDAECDIEILEAKVPLQRITLELPLNHGISAVTFVLRSRDGTRWWRDGDGNFIAPVPGVAQEVPEDPTAGFDELSRDIVACEVQSSEWTLMHRFNKASDILGQQQAGYLKADPEHAAATVYVWLRYSATRQLTWQRNYNTQPRILSSAQDRLTGMIAALHGSTAGEAQEWVRLMLTTVGRGGDGQKIRDEILHIMHRNHIPEKKGLFLEEWHQKLHNNTTPDDVPICEAYLAFLQSNGDTGSYWRVLSDNGVTRERMVSFERPITLEPQFYPDKRDALIRDFRNYLGILKAVHSGADMESAASAAGSSVPKSAKGYLGYVLAHLGDSQILPLMEAAVAARTEIAPHLSGNKDLLYLDLALEDRVRQAAERGAGAVGMAAAAFMTPLLQNVCLSVGNNEELCYCLKAWLSLPDVVRYGGQCSREEALQAAAVVDRIRRAISTLSDRVTQRIEPIATSLGRAFGVEDWVVELFAEEVVRGGPAFAVSLVLSVVEPALRNTAELGSWQVISPYNITGRVCIVSGLQEIQDDVFDEPTVLLAKRVSGEEEIPEGAVAVLTPDAPDVLSHVSVRARNMEVLFATCHDAEAMEQLMAEDGEVLEFSVTAAGAVTWAPGSLGKAASAGGDAHVARRSGSLRIEVPRWCGRWVVPMDEYRDGVVGAKSKNIGHLRGLLPDWIHLPASVTLPFGCFEEALKDNCNREVAKALQAAVKKVPNSPAPALQECRQLVLGMTLPDRLKAALQAGMQEAGIPLPESEERWHMAEASIKGVWASKFNDRAFYSMRKVGLNFMDLRMAVLVQQVVNAEYAFVIHTKNPSTNDDQEIYCEMVRGLGESLVSGMVPGSSLAFVARKDALDRPTLLSYPSKSEGMFCPESLIFRSDSNGEDLQGYAGAGLYDSITMDPTLVSRLDWADDPIVHDDGFRSQLMAKVCSVGHAIEQALGCPQDVEGVVSPNGSITVVQTRPQV